MTPADLLVVGTTARTLDPARPTATAIAVAGDRIVALDGEALALRGAGTEVIDLGGAVTTPGLVDGHMHPLFGAATFHGADLTSCLDLDDVRRMLADAAPGEDGWIVGWGLDHNVFGGGAPTNAVLEEVLPGRPVFLRLYDGHSAIASTEALRRAGVTGPRHFEQRSEVICDRAGVPTGMLLEHAAMELVQAVLPTVSDAVLRDRLREALSGMAATGLTGGCVMDAEAGALELFASYEENGDLPLRLRVAPWCMPGAEVGEVLDLQGRRGRRWSVEAVKFFMDGTVEGGTAWLEHPDCHGTGTEAFWRDPAAYTKAVQQLADARVQTVTHAIGDAAVRHVVEALEHVDTGGVRHRIEHLETLPWELVPRLVRSGLVASMQPVHAGFTKADHSDEWSTRLGAERADRAWVCRDIRDAGGYLVLGSDWPIATYDARTVLAHARLRRAPGTTDAPVAPEQALTGLMALEGMTSHAAYADGATDAGRIAVGYRADLTSFALDPVEAPADELAEAPIRLTVSSGMVTHRD
ncbi:amidohydrolase [Nocardioides cavernaquae]|uniref:Amidohydrolase n=1 Tax=Nocardioides cavernaquae TaxID=2321396 RepID=A0A3A5H4Y5_9ACTN|nr:amidohydrolase [Nocardioides cavernaquae]RJS45766.1 amidohydrolase [Nocardioides cavernaquae]